MKFIPFIVEVLSTYFAEDLVLNVVMFNTVVKGEDALVVDVITLPKRVIRNLKWGIKLIIDSVHQYSVSYHGIIQIFPREIRQE